MRVLCVNPTLEGRMSFKEASCQLKGLESVQVMDSLLDAQDRLFSGSLFHALYLSSHFEKEVLKEFLLHAQRSSGGVDSAYMLTINRHTSEEIDPKYVLEFGFDGFLKTPVQSAVLAGSLEKARQIFKQRQSARQKTAIDILISGIIKNIDEAAQKLSFHEPIGSERKNLTIISKTLRSLPSDLQETYLQKFMNRVEDVDIPHLPTPPPAPSRSSTGPRIIKRGR